MKNINEFRLMQNWLSLFILVFLLFGCEKTDGVEVEKNIYLSLSQATVAVNSSIVLNPHFDGAIRPQKMYTWLSSDTSVIKVEMVDGSLSGLVSAVGEGTATATIVSDDGLVKTSCEILSTQITESGVSLPPFLLAYTQATVTVKPSFQNVDVPTKAYNWSVSPSTALSIEVDPVTYEATILGLEPGMATLTIASTDGDLSASTQVLIEDENDGILKVLAIGNSFSEDALESHLYGLAKAVGKEIIIGNMYIGGAELSLHAENALSDGGNYSYRKIDLNGNKTTVAGTSLSTAVKDENWDYISFQQASYKSGLFETFGDPLTVLYDKVKEINPNEYTRYLLHKTWAYAQNSTHEGFANYNHDQGEMFDAIVDAYRQAKDLIPVYDVIPAGTAIQNARTTYLMDNFTRDGYHLNDMGKYIASCVWFEKLTSESVIGNAYFPDGMIPVNVEISQQAAHLANEFPEEVTVLEDYQNSGGTGILTAAVYIDFSTSSSSPGWNGMTNFLEDSFIPNLLYPDNSFTGIQATITKRFNAASNSAATVTNTDFDMPEEVSRTFYYGNAGNAWLGRVNDTSALELTGFKSDDAYELCFFSSRNNINDTRETKFIVHGEETKTVTVNSSNNSDMLACVSGMVPDEDGVITIEVTAGDVNENANKFFYLSAMRISPE